MFAKSSPPAFKKLFFAHFFENPVISNSEFVFLHYQQVAIWYLIHDFIVRQMQTIHECCNLPQKAIITYCF